MNRAYQIVALIAFAVSGYFVAYANWGAAIHFLLLSWFIEYRRVHRQDDLRERIIRAFDGEQVMFTADDVIDRIKGTK